LRQSHDELQAIYEGMFDGLLIVDLQSMGIVWANVSICRMLGYSEAELCSMSILAIHPADEVPLALQRIQARVEGRLHGHVDIRLMRKDGSIVHVDVVSNRLTYNGRPCIAAFFRDITEQRKAQEAVERERRTLKHMLRASDHERQVIAYDIHDGLAQHLAGAIMQMEVFEHLKDTRPAQAADAFRAGLTMLRQGHFEARRLISGVRPPILDESGVVAAIAHLVHDRCAEQGPQIEFHSRVTFDRLAVVEENAIFRIIQEGVTNACKHSRTQRVRISLLQRDDRILIRIRDWGAGFDPQASRKNRFGLEGIRERARLLGGRCRIRSKPGRGTAIVVELPWAARDDPQ
jgi:PAS domain S-box-containing protein